MRADPGRTRFPECTWIPVMIPSTWARTGDASDATVAVLHEQLARDTGEISWDRIDATGDLEAQAVTWTSRRVAESGAAL